MLITNGTIITNEEPNRILTGQALYIKDGLIRAVGTTADLMTRYPQEERLDAGGQLVMPGNICAHTHFYGAYARGLAIPGTAPKDFPEILRKLWWPLDKALDKDSIRASALVCLVDAVKHGTTTLIDHHASPNYIDGSLDVIADVVDWAGLRAVLCYEVTSRDGEEKMRAGVAENVRFIQNNEHPLIAGTFGLHASLTLSDEALRACADARPDGVGFHVHVAEHESDEDDSQRKSGKRVVERLHEYGMWGEQTIAAHCIHINEDERRILQETGTWVSHQPRSNMNNGVGAMRFDEFVRQGMKVCIGNDGFSNAMWEDWKAAYLLHKVANRDPRQANGADIFRAAAYNNARLAERFFPGTRLGVLAEGAAADIILADYHPYTPLTEGNLPWHILFGFEASMVTTTICAGEILMRDRKLLTLDETEIAAEALALAPKVWERYAANVPS
ncbi:MAG TPA: putative aminohydrolase SsnA [Phototrophicaceae bacterium]|nr:putative aminohydrolase SsnA [Phototrophicaceae bacterium]